MNYIFWLRTKSHGCVHYNCNGVLNVMQTKTRTTSERLSASQKGHCFQMLVGNVEYQWSWEYCQNPSIFLSDVQSTGCSTAYGNTGSCGTICPKARAHQWRGSHSVQPNTVRGIRSEACRSVRPATKGLETLHIMCANVCDCLHHFHCCMIWGPIDHNVLKKTAEITMQDFRSW